MTISEVTSVLVVGPGLNGPGGVANYYSTVYPRLSRPGILPHYLEIGRTKAAWKYMHPFADQVRFGQALSRSKPDLVHINPSLNLKSVLRDGMFLVQAHSRDYRTIVFFRGWEEVFERRISGAWRRLFLRVYGKADAFIVLASGFREKLRSWGIKAPIYSATTAVPDELLEGFCLDAKIKMAESEKCLKVLYLGRLEREKGVIETIEAVIDLARQGMKVSVTVAGDGIEMSNVRALQSSDELAQHVVNIAGYVRGDKKRELLSTHHVYSFPSIYGEGMPNALLEAMAFGMPVITCPVGGIPDFFEQGKMGYLIDSPDTDQIKNCLRGLYEDGALSQEMGRYNHEFARKNFMASRVADHLCTLYQKTVQYRRIQQ